VKCGEEEGQFPKKGETVIGGCGGQKRILSCIVRKPFEVVEVAI
jgi:hypothetical protein